MQVKGPTPEQFESLLAAIPEQHQVLLRVGIETGMRWGELAALRPRHVDVAAQTIVVAETIVEISKKNSPTGERYTVKPCPWNDQQRILKITPELTALLEQRIQSFGPVRDDLLFPSTPRDLRQPTSRNTFRTRVWQPSLKTAGLPKTLRMHDLRHAQAPWLLTGGADLKTVMDHRLGHSQITTPQRQNTPSSPPMTPCSRRSNAHVIGDCRPLLRLCRAPRSTAHRAFSSGRPQLVILW